MLYFDLNKRPWESPIADYLCIVNKEDFLPFVYLKLGYDYDIDENGIIDLRQTPEHLAEDLRKAKENKFAENDSKLNEKRYGQTFSVILQEKECVFDTTEQTQSDLQTAAIVTSTGGTYDNWVTNNGVTINLTALDVQTVFTAFFPLVSPLYQIDLYYKNLIANAQTVAEVEAIEIDYENIDL